MRVWVVTALLSTVSMLILSYIWHGLILTDLDYLPIPLSYFLLCSAIVYLVVSSFLVWAVYRLRKKFAIKYLGFFMGAVTGFFLYLIVFTKGLVFHNYEVSHVILDFIWQMVEQGIGGLIVSNCLLFFGAWKHHF